MAITDNSSNQFVAVPISNTDIVLLDTYFKLHFSTTDHRLSDGAKTVKTLGFLSKVNRDAYYDFIKTVHTVLFNFDITLSDSTDTVIYSETPTPSWFIRFSSKLNEPIDYEFPNSGAYTYDFVLISNDGSLPTYRDNYNLSLLYFIEGVAKPIAELFPHNGGVQTDWLIKIEKLFSPFIYNTNIPNSSELNPVVYATNHIKKIKIMYGEAYQDASIDNGAMTPYAMNEGLSFDVWNGFFRQNEITPVVLNEYFIYGSLLTPFKFLRSWEADDCDVSLNTRDYLNFYLIDGYVNINVRTTIYLNTGQFTTNETNYPVTNKGIYQIAVGPKNNPYLLLPSTEMAAVTHYEIDVIVSDATNTIQSTSEVIAYQINNCIEYDFYFTNRFGVWQRLYTIKKTDGLKELDVTQHVISKSIDTGSLLEIPSFVGNSVTKTDLTATYRAIFDVDTSEDEMGRVVEDFLSSNQKLVVFNNTFYQIQIQNKDFAIKTGLKKPKFQFDFTVSTMPY